MLKKNKFVYDLWQGNKFVRRVESEHEACLWACEDTFNRTIIPKIKDNEDDNESNTRNKIRTK